MNLVYTNHGLERLKERGISKRDIAEALRKGRKSDSENDLRKSVYRTARGTLTVIYNIKNAEEALIVTAYRE
mgnify:CR=1 FL=1